MLSANNIDNASLQCVIFYAGVISWNQSTLLCTEYQATMICMTFIVSTGIDDAA